MEIVEFEEINPVKYKMRIRIEAGVLAKEFEKALGELSRNVEIPGFRLGKAPEKVVERHIGSDEIWRMARDAASYEAFSSALKAKKKSALGEPRFEHKDYLGDGDYEFEVVFHTEPPSPQELVKRAMEPDERMIRPEDHLPEDFLTHPGITSPDVGNQGTPFDHGHPIGSAGAVAPDIPEAPDPTPTGLSGQDDSPIPPDKDPSESVGALKLHPTLPSGLGNIPRRPATWQQDDPNSEEREEKVAVDPDEKIPDRFKKPTVEKSENSDE